MSLKHPAAGPGRAAATPRCVLSACTSSSVMLMTSSWARGRGPHERKASERKVQMSLMAAAAAAAVESADSAAATTQVKTRKVRRLPSSSGRRMADEANETEKYSYAIVSKHNLTIKVSESVSPSPARSSKPFANGDPAAATNKHLQQASRAI